MVRFDSSIPFIKFQNDSQVHFKKRSFVIVKNEIDSIDINFIKVVKTDQNDKNISRN